MTQDVKRYVGEVMAWKLAQSNRSNSSSNSQGKQCGGSSLMHPDDILEGFANLDFDEYKATNKNHVFVARTLMWFCENYQDLDAESLMYLDDRMDFDPSPNPHLQHAINLAEEMLETKKVV